MERKSNRLIGLTFYLENSVSFFLSSKKLRVLIYRFVIIPGYENKFQSLSKHVQNGK